MTYERLRVSESIYQPQSFHLAEGRSPVAVCGFAGVVPCPTARLDDWGSIEGARWCEACSDVVYQEGMG